MSPPPRLPITAGIVLLIAGFMYLAVFAGLPYPDPTPTSPGPSRCTTGSVRSSCGSGPP